MKKIITLLMLLVSLASANAKCNWSGLNLQQWNQRNYYKWYLTGKVLDDTCVSYMFTIIDVQTKKLDTVYSYRGLCEVQFNKKGKYYLRVVLKNKCKGCDTLIYRPIELIYFPNSKFSYKMFSTDKTCNDSIVGEMTMGPGKSTDTCWQWYMYLYNGPELDSLSQHDWDSMSDSQLYNYYSFQDSDLVLYQGPKVTDRILKHRFTKEGHYLVVTQWYNKCLNQDTFTLTRLTVDLCTTSGVVTLIKPSPKLIGIYDMLGRQVDYMRSNEIYIMKFDNGQSRKIMRVER